MATANTESHEYHSHASLYVKIWAVLLVLLVISVLGPMLEIPALTLITAFGIAIVKASLVVKFFMHLDLEPKFIWYILTVSLSFMALFFFAVAPDVMNHEGTNWDNVAAKAAVERGMEAGDPAQHHAEGGAEHGGGAHDEAAGGEEGGH